MPINVNDPEYVKAEKEFHEAKSLDEQLFALQKMISHAPAHKGAENLRQQLTQKRKRLEEQIEKKKKVGKSSQQGIRKTDMQAVLVGKTNVGKSSLLKVLTNASPKISHIKFTTNEPIIGMMDYENTQIQLIEIPAIDGEHFEKGIIHTADTILIVVTKFEDIEEIDKKIPLALGKKIVVFNKSDLLTKEEIRKIEARLKSKKYNFEIISSVPYWPGNNLEDLKKKIFESFDIVRIFTKEPGKEKSNKPMIMKPGSTVSDAAEKILKGLSKRIKETKIWGPGSKFGGQKVGLNYLLKDLMVVEFKTN